MVWWLLTALQLRVVKSSSSGSKNAHLLTLDTSLHRCTCISVSRNAKKINGKREKKIKRRRDAMCEFLVLDPFPEMLK